MRIVVAVILSLSASVSLPAAAPGPDDRVLRFDSSTKVVLCTACPIQKATFQVTVVTGADGLKLATGEAPAIVGVSSPGQRIENPQTQFVPSWERGDSGEPAVLVITISPPLDQPGTYDVVLNLLPKSRRRAPRETVQVVVPEATIQGPSKLFIERTIHWLGADEMKQTPLYIRETGRAAAVRQITLASEPFAIGAMPISGRIVSVAPAKPNQGVPDQTEASGEAAIPARAASPAELRSGDGVTLDYGLTGDFPSGTASGAIRLSAAELKSPLLIPVEVRSRLSRWHLAGVILGGLLLSWWIKVWLQGRIQINEARVAAATLLRDVDRSGYADEQFHSRVEPLSGALLAAANARADAKKIDDARSALDKEWRLARQDVETRRTAFRTLLERWRNIVSLPWELPPEVDAAVVSGRALRPAMVLDQLGDIGRALVALETIQSAAADATHKRSREWQRTSRALFDRLLSTSEGISDAILQPLRDAVLAWRARYIAIEPAPIDDPEKVEPLLRPVMGEYVAVLEHLEEVGRRLKAEYHELEPKLTAHGVGADLVTAIGVRLNSLIEALALAADEPSEVDANLTTRLHALQQSWAAAFAGARGATPAVLAAVAARDFRGAAELLDARAPRDVPPSGGGLTASAPDAFAIRLSMPPRAPGVVPDATAVDPVDPYTALLLESSRSIMTEKLIQTLIVGALFLLWATMTYGRTFDGTAAGLSTAFFSAFGLDVGLDALLGRIKS